VKNLYIGVMSGTSLDGVDIALCEISTQECKLLEYKEFSFPPKLKELILGSINATLSLKDVGILDHKLGQLFASSLLDFLKLYNLNSKEIKAIGLHGQTLWHEPKGASPFSMQLGDANIVAAKTGITTVADFRRMDIANGGEGAPFAPAFHQFVFKQLKGKNAVLNIGGMANITLLQEPLLGWDSGCGNVLLDYWVNKTQLKPYDKDGLFAKSGVVNKQLLNTMLCDSYFKKEPPKSTGREYFNAAWLEAILENFTDLSDADVQRTLLELTAQSISDALKAHSLTTLIVCGGGSKNTFLMQRLQELSGLDVKRSDTYDVNSDALEAMAFAWLAYKRIEGEVVELKSVTGATKNSQLGAIYG